MSDTNCESRLLKQRVHLANKRTAYVFQKISGIKAQRFGPNTGDHHYHHHHQNTILTMLEMVTRMPAYQ